MAITKLHRYKEETLKDGGYKRAVKYICNPYKTDGGTLIGGNCGCDPERAFETMIFNKAAHGKADGTAGFHYKISFPPDEAVTPEAAMRVTEEFCRELLGGEWPVIYSVHTDKAHLALAHNLRFGRVLGRAKVPLPQRGLGKAHTADNRRHLPQARPDDARLRAQGQEGPHLRGMAGRPSAGARDQPLRRDPRGPRRGRGRGGGLRGLQAQARGNGLLGEGEKSSSP